MKKFLLHTVLFIAVAALMLEVFYETSPSVFSIRTFTAWTLKHTKTFFKSTKVNKSNAVEGKTEVVVSEVKNVDGELIKLHRNNIGFYAHINFYQDSLPNNNYAVIGDSFVNSMVCGTYNSISYLLDKELDNKNVYNFGVNGGNINDYYKIYNTYGLAALNTVFIVLTGSHDLFYKNLGADTTNYRWNLEKIYFEKLKGSQVYSNANYSLIRNDYKNVVLIVHDDLKKKTLIDNGVTLPILEVFVPNKLRYSDGHYKREGNKIIADKIKAYLDSLDTH